MHIIQSITLKGDYPFVRSNSGSQDCVTPGRKTEPILPTIAFNRAVDTFADLLFSEYSLPVIFEWKLKGVTFVYNEEDGKLQCFKASVGGFEMDWGRLAVTIDPQSKQNVSPEVKKALEELRHQAELFVDGASAQGSLFDVVPQDEAVEDDDEIEEDAA